MGERASWYAANSGRDRWLVTDAGELLASQSADVVGVANVPGTVTSLRVNVRRRPDGTPDVPWTHQNLRRQDRHGSSSG